MSKKALIRQPSLRLAEGIVTTIERQPVDVELATKQWASYVEALQAAGWETILVPPVADCPDSVFVEDTMVVYKDVAVIAHPGAVSRQPEIVAAEAVVGGLGFRSTGFVTRHPGWRRCPQGRRHHLRRGGRADQPGGSPPSCAPFCTPLGATVVAVPVHKVLHLKSAVTALPDGTVIGYLPLVDDPSVFPRVRAVPDESGAHVVDLDEHRILMAADCPRSAEMFAGLGYEPITVNIGEFQKLEGCVTCLSVRLRSLPDALG